VCPEGNRIERHEQRDALPRPKTSPLIGTRKVPPPEIVPARMVNEVLYCERLMYLEWVQGELADNAFTVEVRFTHTRADSPGGKLPAPPTVVVDADEEEKRCLIEAHDHWSWR
jgi:hypothetical protein